MPGRKTGIFPAALEAGASCRIIMKYYMAFFLTCVAICIFLALYVPETDTNAETTLDSDVTDISYEEAISASEKILGKDCMDYFADADGVRDGAFVSICLKAKTGKEDEAVSLLNTLCGKGEDAGKRPLPATGDRICQKLREMEPLRVYDYMRQGENGAKTKTTEIYTAQSDKNLYLFLFE